MNKSIFDLIEEVEVNSIKFESICNIVKEDKNLENMESITFESTNLNKKSTGNNITVVYSDEDKLKDVGIFKKVEDAYGVTLPNDLKKFIELYNGCTIEIKFIDETSEYNTYRFDMKDFNENSSFNILDDFDIKYYNNESTKFIPLLHDGMGNYYGITKDGVSYHNHETDKISKITTSWTKFLSNVKFWKSACDGTI
jgi:SMI1 / KNR4 family.